MNVKELTGIELYEIGCDYFDTGKYQESIKYFKEALELSEQTYSNLPAYNGWVTLIAKERNILAPVSFDLADAKAKFGESLRKEGYLELAIKEIEEALELRVEPEYFLWSAHTAHQLGDFETAAHGYVIVFNHYNQNTPSNSIDFYIAVTAERMLMKYQQLNKTKFSQNAIKKGFLSNEDLDIIEEEISKL